MTYNPQYLLCCHTTRSVATGFALCLIALLLTPATAGAQADSMLKKLTEGVISIRDAKASKAVLNTTVIDWSASGKPKLTLMDELERDTIGEYRSAGANKFRLNQVVTFVYNRQNTGMVTKGDYFNSTEKGIHYSAIEKNIRKQKTVSYNLTGHEGPQEFVVVAFNPKTRFSATIGGTKATMLDNGAQVVRLKSVGRSDTITIKITNESQQDDSFVILNYNPQQQ